jgi:hypothetical protein
MYNQTLKQIESEKTLVKRGFRFSNWISAQTGNPDEGTMVFKKRGATRYSTEYREIEPDGSIN